MTMPREQAVAVLEELLRNRPTLAPRLGAVLYGGYEMFLVFGPKFRNKIRNEYHEYNEYNE